MGTINISLSRIKERPKEEQNDITITFFKDNILLGNVQISSKKYCIIGKDDYTTSVCGFDTDKLLKHFDNNRFYAMPKEYDELMVAKWKFSQLTDKSSIMDGIKDYINKIEEYFKIKAY